MLVHNIFLIFRFFIESSLVQHRERRSVWINLECGPCDAKLTFYNRCALKGDIHCTTLDPPR